MLKFRNPLLLTCTRMSASRRGSKTLYAKARLDRADIRMMHTTSGKKFNQEQHWSDFMSPRSEQTVECAGPEESFRPSTPEDEKSVLTLLKDVLSYHDSNMSSWVVENKANSLASSYCSLSKNHKENVIKALARKYAVDHQKVYQALNQFKELSPQKPISLNEERQLKEALSPLYIWLFKTIGRLEGGVKFLVDLRRDLLTLIPTLDKKCEDLAALQQLNANLKDLLTLWFSVGFLNLERVTWKSSCEMLQKISEYEAVHPVRNWTDLKRRVGPYRRCFVYTHSAMPSEPIVVLHTALCADIASTTQGIIALSHRSSTSVNGSDTQVEDPTNITTAIFYSITSTQPGLQGIELGNYLIKRVVQELQTEFPQLTQYSTLSPIPMFKIWLSDKLNSLEKGESETELARLWTPAVNVSGGWKDLKKRLLSNAWVHDPELVTALQKPLMTTCAIYLYKEKKRGMALDNVANFHLKNGAVMWRLNWLADTSPRGMTNSCGLMVNYRYFLEDTESNSRNYLENKTINASDSMKSLLGDQVFSKL